VDRLETAIRRATLTLDLVLGLVLAGIGDLAINAWMVYLGHPGLSLVAAYQRGREPWTSLGIGAVIGGASAAIAIGAALALAQGSWIRRLLALAVVSLGVAWWLTALSVLPWAGLTGPDPMGFAFVHVREALLGLLLPAVAAGLLVFTPRRERPTSRMAPVHPDEWR
jgi:hypothetical protein